MMRKPLYRENGIERKYICALFGVSIFVCLYIFFTKVTPLYIIDLDDWLYNYYFRRPIPSVRELNPIKILPETWMPITSYLGTYLIYPFTGDLIAAWAMAYAAVLSLMITVYILGAVKVLGKWFEIKNLPLQMIYAVIFLLSHFAVMFQNTGKSHHLFLARDVTCVFNYTIPTLAWVIFDNLLQFVPEYRSHVFVRYAAFVCIDHCYSKKYPGEKSMDQFGADL